MLAIVFSRDRAMQLDATLRSFFLHCRDAYRARLFVIYYASDDLHAQQYLGLKQAYRHVHFIQQQSFREDVLGRLMFGAIPLPEKARRLGIRLARKNDRFARLTFALLRRPAYLLFLVDDNLFVRDFTLAEITKELVANPQALGFSLRLGSNTVHCYVLNRSQEVPVFTSSPVTIRKYNWTLADGDFGYPLEVSSSVFQLKDLQSILFHFSFKNPNELETQLSSQADCFRETKPDYCCVMSSLLPFVTRLIKCKQTILITAVAQILNTTARIWLRSMRMAIVSRWKLSPGLLQMHVTKKLTSFLKYVTFPAETPKGTHKCILTF